MKIVTMVQHIMWPLTDIAASTGVINTPLGRHVYGESYLGAAAKLAIGVLAWPWFKSPAQGAATSITAAVSPDLEAHSGDAQVESKE